MTATLQRLAGDASRDREHVQLVLARLWAAEHALADEIAANLDVSEECAVVLARMQIDELIDARRKQEDDLAPDQGNEAYCEQCWALLASEDAARVTTGNELFSTCFYCGPAVYPEQEWEDAA